MKEQIEAVERYFKNKILAKDFVITKMEPAHCNILIDGEYIFYIWIANFDIPNTRKLSDIRPNYMYIKFTDEEAIQLHEILKDEIADFIRKNLIEQKRKEIEALEKTLL